MVKLRLMRTGRRNRGAFRFVAEHLTDGRDSAGIEFLGYYDSNNKKEPLKLDEEGIYKWLKRGAIPSETFRNLLKKQGIWKKWMDIQGGKDVTGVVATPKAPKKKRPKKRGKTAEAAPAAAPQA